MDVKSFLLVGAGGAIGSMLRYAAALVNSDRLFPYSTFFINILGSFLIGIFLGLLLKNNLSDYGWKFLATGVCGGFTTFSAFSLEGFELLEQKHFFIFFLYFLLSMILGVAAAYAGYSFSK